MLDRIIEEKWLTANGVIGFFPANAVGDDIEVYRDAERTEVLTVLHNLRQQGQHREGVPNRSLGDFVAPKDTGLADHVGAFAVTAGLGSQDKIKEFKDDLDDYSAILLESLADRLAEAFAERLHQRVRIELWGHVPDEQLANEDLIAEKYTGIRPAPGYPACPEHTEKETLWELLDVEGDDRHRAHRVDGDVAGRLGQRLVLLPPAGAVLRGRPARARPGGVVRRAQGVDPPGGRALALLQPRLRPGRLMSDTDVPNAVLWDMDGTLVDTEPYWMECEFELAEKYGGRWSHEDGLAVVGGDLLDSATYMRDHMGIDRTPLQIIEELLDGVVVMVEQEMPWKPGARELLTELRGLAVPCALVTMSWRRFVEPVLRALPEGSFDAVVCGDEVDRGKPHPDAYLLAADLLGLDAGSTVAIEDSPPGPPPRASAGCQVLVVPSHVPVPSGDRRVQRDSLVGITARDLARLS